MNLILQFTRMNRGRLNHWRILRRKMKSYITKNMFGFPPWLMECVIYLVCSSQYCENSVLYCPSFETWDKHCFCSMYYGYFGRRQKSAFCPNFWPKPTLRQRHFQQFLPTFPSNMRIFTLFGWKRRVCKFKRAVFYNFETCLFWYLKVHFF